MNGKILKVSGNDLYGNPDERTVSVFACFIHKKYMNRYIIFSFTSEYNKKELCYGSVHLKENSLVTFSVRDELTNVINEFLESYLNNNINEDEYEIIDISNLSKIELVSYSKEPCEVLEELDKLSIKRVNPEVDNIATSSGIASKIVLYIILFILILSLGGVTYLYFFPEDFTVINKKLTCTTDVHNNQVDLDYTNELVILFNHDDTIKEINVTDTYIFSTLEEYEEFKNNKKEESFKIKNGGYKYIDEDLTLKLIYQEQTIINDYSEMKKYMKNEGYECSEGEYEE